MIRVITVCCILLVACTTKVDQSGLELLKGSQSGSASLPNKISRRNIYLPPGYDPDRVGGYPVIYYLGDTKTLRYHKKRLWNNLNSAISSEILKPAIVVTVDLSDPDLASINSLGFYEASVVQDVFDYVELAFNTKTGREGRSLVGGKEVVGYALENPQKIYSTALLRVTGPCYGGDWIRRDMAEVVSGYIKQPLRVRFYLISEDDSCQNNNSPSNGKEYSFEKSELFSIVRLYQILHRENLFNSSFEKGTKVSANPAQLRIIGGSSKMSFIQAFMEAAKYNLGDKESQNLNPSYKPSDYYTEEPGTVVAKRYKISKERMGSKVKADSLSYKVYLPYGYDPKGSTKYPVLYLLHGSGGDQGSWNAFWPILDTLIEEKTIPKLIAVAPVTGNSYWVDSYKYGAVESSLIQNLVPRIDNNYNTINNRDGRGLIGFSMGGYGALRFSLLYPDLFGAASLLSPAVQYDEAPETSGAVQRGSFGEPYDPREWEAKNYPVALESYRKQSYRVPIFIIIGDDDWNHVNEKEDLPDGAYRYNMEFQATALYLLLTRSMLNNRASSSDDRSPSEFRVVNGGHDINVWATGFERGIIYMFSNAMSAPYVSR